MLLHDSHAGFPQFMRQGVLLDLFQKTGAEGIEDGKSTTNDARQ
jgi:hypothetical protein